MVISLILILFSLNAGAKPMNKIDRLEIEIQALDSLIQHYIHQQNIDRHQIEARDLCFKRCHITEPYSEMPNADNSRAQECTDECDKLPSPPGGC